MRLNQYLAQATGLSRRAADTAISEGRVMVDGAVAALGVQVEDQAVTLDGKAVSLQSYIYLLLNKPPGYVCSRLPQGNSPTIYDLLPAEYHQLKPVGRLDKNSCGLLLLTNDGPLAQELTHPSYGKTKHYTVKLDRKLTAEHREQLTGGVELEDGLSHLVVEGDGQWLKVTMQEGRNRQIRRTFAALGYKVTFLERIGFAKLNQAAFKLKPSQWRLIDVKEIK